MSYVKSITSKPVVTVGRFTSPDTMVSQVKRGITDFIGAARPSIADPFLPNKIKEGEIDSIRECIGCNICYTGDGLGVPLHCTQNPTFSEGWRRGWHPERIPTKKSNASVLVIGAGPAGLEATRALGQRGYQVLLAEKTNVLGGRVAAEAKLPGLSEWIRVRDYRVRQIQQMNNVDVYLDSEMSARDALDTDVEHIVVATGATWRADGVGRYHDLAPVQYGCAENVFTPDDIFAGRLPTAHVTVFDDDHYYYASVLSEYLRHQGLSVTLLTPATQVAAWSTYTAEQHRVQARLMQLGVTIITARGVQAFDGQQLVTKCIYSGEETSIVCDQLLTVTSRLPNDALYQQLRACENPERLDKATAISRIGDCDAPSIIATAVFAGHRYARELEENIDRVNPMKYDRVVVSDEKSPL